MPRKVATNLPMSRYLFVSHQRGSTVPETRSDRSSIRSVVSSKRLGHRNAVELIFNLAVDKDIYWEHESYRRCVSAVDKAYELIKQRHCTGRSFPRDGHRAGPYILLCRSKFISANEARALRTTGGKRRRKKNEKTKKKRKKKRENPTVESRSRTELIYYARLSNICIAYTRERCIGTVVIFDGPDAFSPRTMKFTPYERGRIVGIIAFPS